MRVRHQRPLHNRVGRRREACLSTYLTAAGSAASASTARMQSEVHGRGPIGAGGRVAMSAELAEVGQGVCAGIMVFSWFCFCGEAGCDGRRDRTVVTPPTRPAARE